MSVARWTVPRPGPDGEPLGVLVVEVVPAEAYDRLREALEAIAATEAAMVPGRKWVHWRTQAEEALS